MNDAVDEHLRHLKRRNLRPSTIDQRRRALHRLAVYLNGIPLLAVTPGELEGFLDRDLTPEARATEISHLRGYYRWAVEVGLIDVNPSRRVARPKLPRRFPRPMPDADLAVAVAVAPDHVRLALLLAAYAGLRACEIAGLNGESVMLDADPPVLLVVEEKGGDMASVPLGPYLIAELEEWPRSGWYFPYRDGRPLAPWPPHRVSQVVNQYLHGLGIAHTLHTARHWFGTKTYRASGRDLRATQELMRHRASKSTEGYTWVDPGDLTATVNRLPALGQQRERLF
jgi:integrase/recombinase XerD